MGKLEQGICLRQTDWNIMLFHIKKTFPEEGCGLVGGNDGCSKVVFKIKNSLQSQVRFRMDAQEQLRALLAIENSGLDLIAIYHSHPSGPEHPSQIDLDEYAYPDTAYLIWSPVGDEWICRAFKINQGLYFEIPITILKDV